MPSLPIKLPCRIDAGSLPVVDEDDVLAAWSGDLASLQTAPVRDAIVAGQLAGLTEYQRATAYAAAQSDSLRATGEYLDEIGSFERGVKRGTGETDDAYRARVNATPSTVDPLDVLAAANAVLAAYTDVACRYAEHSDGVFPGSPTAASLFAGASYARTATATSFSAHAFADQRSPSLFTAADGGAGATPNYPDRQYAAIPGRRPAGTMATGVGLGPASWPIAVCPQIVRTPFPGTVSVVLASGVTPELVGVGTSFTKFYRVPNGVPPTNGKILALSNGTGFVIIQVVSVITDDTHLFFGIWDPALPIGVTAWNGEGSGTVGTVLEGLSLFDVALSTQAISDEYGRYFHLRVPDISAIDTTVNAAYQLGGPQPPETPFGGGGSFPGNPTDGVTAKNGVFAFDIEQTSDGVYQALIDSVEAIRPQSTRWSMLSDPNLTT